MRAQRHRLFRRWKERRAGRQIHLSKVVKVRRPLSRFEIRMSLNDKKSFLKSLLVISVTVREHF